MRATSADPFAPPIIQPNYLSADEDKAVLLAGIKLSRRLMRTDALAPYFDYEAYPGDAVQSDDEAVRLMNDCEYGLTAAVFSTCMARVEVRSQESSCSATGSTHCLNALICNAADRR